MMTDTPERAREWHPIVELIRQWRSEQLDKGKSERYIKARRDCAEQLEAVCRTLRDPQPEKTTRFEVINETGRVLTRWGVKVKLSYQDDGRTLKVFLSQRDGKSQRPT